jgi:hypothetical protein
VDRSLRTRQAHHRKLLLLYLCGALFVSLTLSRHLIICRHDGGDSHVVIQRALTRHHQPGSLQQAGGQPQHRCCACGSHGTAATSADHDLGRSVLHEHLGCNHTDFFIDVDSQRDPEHSVLPLPPTPAALAPMHARSKRYFATKVTQPPPATGPPRPARFLSQRATTLLLI